MISTFPRWLLPGLSRSVLLSKKTLISSLIGGVTAFVAGYGLPVSLGVAAGSAMVGYWCSLKTKAVSTTAPSIGLKTQKVAAQLIGPTLSGIDDPKDRLDQSALKQFSRLLFLGSPKAVSILKSRPELLPLKEVVDDYLRNHQPDMVPAIYVLLGIKPVLAIEVAADLPDDVLEKLKKMISLNPRCHVIEPSDSCKSLYFVNESPLPNYDPWVYLDPVIRQKFNSSISRTIQFYFPIAINESSYSAADLIMPLQICSYILGYGPTWEAYMHRIFFSRGLKEFATLHNLWVFSDRHYQQLGQALKTNGEEGRRYSVNFWKKPQKTFRELNLMFSKAEAMTNYLNLSFVYDEVSIKTPYLRELIADSSKVMDFLCFYHPDYRSKKPPGLDDWVLHATFGIADLL